MFTPSAPPFQQQPMVFPAYDAVSQTLLNAEISVSQGQVGPAVQFYNSMLQNDPTNPVVLIGFRSLLTMFPNIAMDVILPDAMGENKGFDDLREKFLNKAETYAKLSPSEITMLGSRSMNNWFSRFLWAYCMKDGIGIEKNGKEAFQVMFDLAKQGFAVAQYNVAIMFESGVGIDENQEEYRFWCKKAAENRLAIAQCEIGRYMVEESGENDLGMEYLQSAASQDYPLAICTVGVISENEKDVKEAEELYKRATKLGDAYAAYSLGILYQEQKKKKDAAKYFGIGADMGNADAMYAYAICLHGGKGVKKDEEMARTYYAKAAEAGCEEAIEFMKEWNES